MGSIDSNTGWKVPKYGVISGPYLPVFGQDMEIYRVNLRVNLRIQLEYRKIRIEDNCICTLFTQWNDTKLENNNNVIDVR